MLKGKILIYEFCVLTGWFLNLHVGSWHAKRERRH